LRNIITSFFLVFLFSGCTPANLVTYESPSEDEKASVLIYRDYAYQYSAVDIVFGINDKDIIKLEDTSFAQVDFQAGKQNLFVRTTQADRPETLALTLKPGDLVCLRTVAKPSYYAKMLTFGLSSLVTSMFSLEQVTCPTKEFLSNYKEIKQLS
jgi:hypothetical protein